MTSHPTNKRLLILFANLKGNLGDFAILHAMLIELGRRYPGREVDVAPHGHKTIDEERLQAFLRQPHPPFVLIEKTPYQRPPWILNVIKKFALEQVVGGYLIDRLSARFKNQAPISSAGEYEAVFLAGGEQWGGFSGSINMFAILDAVSRINPNVFAFPFSVKKRILKTYSLERLKSSFAKISDNLVVRDSNSGDTMSVISPRVTYGADCVFSLANLVAGPAPAPQADVRPLIIAVTAADGSRRRCLLAATKALRDGGYRVRLFTTCAKEDSCDMLAVCRALGVDFVAPATWQEVVAEFRSAELVVTNRLHCMIFSLFSGTPVLPLLNREKITGIQRDAELPHALHDMSELTPQMVRQCAEDRSEIQRKMAAYLGKISKLDTAPWTS